MSNRRKPKKDNLKEDFVWFQPNPNGQSAMRCTCKRFYVKSDDLDSLAKSALEHHKQTGHTLHPRGN